MVLFFLCCIVMKCVKNYILSVENSQFYSQFNTDLTVKWLCVLYFRLHHQRFVEAFWPNNTALFDSKYAYENKNYNTQINGSVLVEIPLQTRHVGNLVYGYKARLYTVSFYSCNPLLLYLLYFAGQFELKWICKKKKVIMI